MNAKEKATNTAKIAKRTPYVQLLLHDDQLRNNMRQACDAAYDAYRRLANGKDPSKLLAQDKKLHKDLKVAAEALHDATSALRSPKRQKSGGSKMFKLLFIGVVGGTIAMILNENLRNKVLDKLFGAEEEFVYPSTEPQSAPQPPGNGAKLGS